MEYVKVVIVGGGAAGLGAAKTLGSDVNYLLVEAQGYLGGRIRTVDAAPNVAVDLGAQFIHGKTNNPVYEICNQLNCISSNMECTDDEVLVITSDRTKLDSNIVRKAMAVWEELVTEAQAKFGDATIPTHYSFSDFLSKHFKERLISSLTRSHNLIDTLMEFFQKNELIENGCVSLAELSLAEYGSFEHLDGQYHYELLNGGYRPLISYLKSFIPDDNRIRLNSEVIRVKYLADNHQLLVDIRHLHGTSQEEINTIRCDHMIWTSSLGYLKENFTSIFADESELIEQKTNAINNLGFDTVNKVVLIYAEHFWPKELREIILLPTEKQQLIQLSDSLTKLLETEKTDVQIVNTIIKAIYRYDILTSPDVPILICWFGGKAAVLSENLTEKILGQICHEVLCHYLNISPESNPPNRVFKSEWYKNRFIRGSYSYYSTKSPAKDGEKLRSAYAPDGVARIQFAGEATHEKYYSTVHGALESGICEATKLLAIINR